MLDEGTPAEKIVVVEAELPIPPRDLPPPVPMVPPEVVPPEEPREIDPVGPPEPAQAAQGAADVVGEVSPFLATMMRLADAEEV